MHCVVKIILTGMSRVHTCVGMLNSLQSYNILLTYSHGKLFHNFSIILFPTFQCRVYIEVYGSGHMHAGLAVDNACIINATMAIVVNIAWSMTILRAAIILFMW